MRFGRPGQSRPGRPAALTAPVNHATLAAVKFLKVLLNGLLSGAFMSLLLALLLFDLNANLRPGGGDFGAAALGFFIAYGLPVAALAVLLFFVIQFFSSEGLAIRPVSPSFLAVSLPVLTVIFLFLLHRNLVYFASFFDAATVGALRTQGLILGGAALLGPAALYAGRKTRRRGVFFAGFYLVFGAAVAGVLLGRAGWPAPAQPVRTARLQPRTVTKKILLIQLSGMSFDFLLPLMAEDKLPNISWLVENGAWGRLQTLSPAEALPLEATLTTGKLPSRHRRISPFTYSFSRMAAKPEVFPRYILFRQLQRFGLLRVEPRVPEPSVKDIFRILRDNGARTLQADRPAGDCADRPDPPSEKEFATIFQLQPTGSQDPLLAARRAFLCDLTAEDLAFARKGLEQPHFYALHLDGLNTAQAFYYKYSHPNLFGNIAQEDIRRYGTIIETYYAFYDRLIGKYLASRKDDELLVVCSAFGVEPLPLWKRFVELVLGNPAISASHEDAPDGVVFFAGRGVRRGANVEGFNIADLTPTLLYYLGLPVGRDMDGIVQGALFAPDFTAENPIMTIGSYEEVAVEPRPPEAPDGAAGRPSRGLMIN